MGIALGEAGEVADEIANYKMISRITANPADRWTESTRELRAVRNPPTSYAIRSSTKRTIASCSETAAELEYKAGNEDGKGRAFSRAVPFLLVLDLLE
jgi:hypothetical protein